MILATVSLNQIWENKKENLILCEAYIKKASDKKVDLIVFPEMTLTGFSTNIEKTAEEENSSETIKNFQDLARSFNIAILFGVVINDGKKVLNRSVFVDNEGTVLAKYSKIHPFSFAGEDKYFNSGNKLVQFKFKDATIGLTICYDLRFPELYSAYSKECDIIINIANWPSKRIEHWNTLLKARAIENQVIIVGVNRTGSDASGLEYCESSNIFNADGKKLDFEQLNEIKIFEINKNRTEEFKKNFNTTNDRKIEFYKGTI